MPVFKIFSSFFHASTEKLDLKKNVVRVWFCNQRQKQKRMKFSAARWCIMIGRLIDWLIDWLTRSHNTANSIFDSSMKKSKRRELKRKKSFHDHICHNSISGNSPVYYAISLITNNKRIKARNKICRVTGEKLIWYGRHFLDSYKCIHLIHW